MFNIAAVRYIPDTNNQLEDKGMGKQLLRVSSFMLYFLTSVIYASPVATQRVAQFSNNKVSVWKTIILPKASQGLKMHRHDHDRVLVALNNGKLKITNDKGKVHYLNLKKDKAYLLKTSR